MNIEEFSKFLEQLFMQFGVQLVSALAVLIIGWWVVGRIINIIVKSMKKARVEVTLQKFLTSFINISFKAILLIIVASMVGVETTSLIAVLGAAGLAIGLALQGSLSNLAGGVLILFFKPFKVGDVIDAQGYVGVVEEIQIFNTFIKTLDNQQVFIPNGLLSNGCVKNVFAEPIRRVDMTYGISYSDDIAKAKQVVRDTLNMNKHILKDPIADVFVSAHADSSINLTVRPWCDSNNYWNVYFETHEALKIAFDREGIVIPFPQRDVHVHNVNS